MKTDKKNECACGPDCHCHETSRSCGCGHSVITLLSALIVAGAIVYTGLDCPKKRHVTPPRGADFARSANMDAAFTAFIKKNPQVIIETLDSHFKKEQAKAAKAAAPQPASPADVQKLANTIIADKSNYSIGNPDGKFVIIEFFDYNCGWCKKTNHEMWEAVHSDAGKNIRWILIDTPIFGEKSELISRYVLAAGQQGKFKEMHHAVLKSASKKDEADLIKMGEELKLDTKKLTADANSDAIKNKIAANREYTRSLRIGGVPMLIVNGKLHQGALLGDKLKAAVEESNGKPAAK